MIYKRIEKCPTVSNKMEITYSEYVNLKSKRNLL